MLKKSTLVQIISEDLSELWNILSPEEKRIVTDNFTILHYKKGQIIYAEHEEPENLWCLLKGKVKMYKSGIGDRVQILRLYLLLCSISATGHILPEKIMSPPVLLLRLQSSAVSPCI